MPGFDVKTLSDLSDQLKAWEAAFIGPSTHKRFERAATWTVDEIVKGIAVGMREAMGEALDNPTPWTARAFQYTRSLGKAKTLADGVASDVYALPDQSIVLKYLMGETGENERLPGDVGPARDKILIPNFKNLAHARGVRANSYGNLPSGALASIARDAETYTRSTPSRWGVWKGMINVKGSPVLAYIARPPRVRARVGGTTVFASQRGQRAVPYTVNSDLPRILFFAVDRARYTPVLQPYWVRLQEEGIKRIPGIMAAELADAVAYQARQGRMR